MAIITLTTDMGNGGYYVASLKAAVLSESPLATIVDITHGIQPFHVSAAAFTLRNAYAHFPADTVHIAWVQSPNSPTTRFIALKANAHYFIGPDNGLFSLALNIQPDKIISLSLAATERQAVSVNKLLAKTAAHIANGDNLADLGNDCSDYLRPAAWQPTYNADSISAAVLYVDNYGNCICNIDKALFEQVGKQRNIQINIKGYEIDSISKNYLDKGNGDLVALFSETGLLKLAMNYGNLSQILGIKEGDMIKIVFVH